MENMQKKPRPHMIKLLPGLFALVFAMVLLPQAAWAAPVIFYTDIVSGPKTGGENNNGAYLSIFGKGFGTFRGSSTVKIGGGEVAVYKVWSDTEVSVQLGPAVSSGSIVLTTSAGSAIGPDSFTVRPGSFYFVSLSGTDNGSCGAIGSPCRTPNYVRGLGAFGAGDFIIVRGGTYDINDGTNNLDLHNWLSVRGVDGSSGSPITFMGYPGETVTVQIDDNTSHFWRPCCSTGADWWVVADFDISLESSSARALLMASPGTCDGAETDFVHNMRIVNLDIDGNGVSTSDTGGTPFEIVEAENVKAFGIDIHDTTDTGGARTHVIYISGRARNIEVGYGHLYNLLATRAVIHLHVNNNSGCWGKKSITDIYLHDLDIHNTNGQAIQPDGGTGDIYIYNNVIYDSPNGSGIANYPDVLSLRGAGGELEAHIYNNTIYVNPNSTGEIIGVGFGASYCPISVTLTNNIFVTTDSKDAYMSDNNGCVPGTTILASDYNNYYGSSGRYPGLGSAGAHDVNSDPLFVNAGSADFNLQSGSPAIDAGTTTGAVRDFGGDIRPQGGAFDIGAYEYCGASCVVADNTPPAAPTGVSVAVEIP